MFNISTLAVCPLNYFIIVSALIFHKITVLSLLADTTILLSFDVLALFTFKL
jgi:hypothetical protein